jgi:DNA-binding transcriptional ArsR family regulator
MINEIEHFDWEEQEIASHFELETVEQLQAISDPIRYRMVLLLREKAMTGAQLARALGLSRSRAHYYLKTLVDSGLVTLRGEKIDNGLIGKYYRSIANYFSYDRLASQSREKPADDPASILIYKAISNFALTVLETSRDNILQSEELARGYHFNFESDLTEEQYNIIINEIKTLADHLIKIKHENQQKRDPNASLLFRTTVFFTPIPRNPILFEPPTKVNTP